jgi:nitrite reductase (NADH) small subunit
MWTEVTTAAELEKARKLIVDVGDRRVALFWHDGEVYAFDNECIHRQRDIGKGVILNGRVVCPGHQWAFELGTGYCRERDRSQPIYPVRIEDERVLVEIAEPAAEAG